MNLLLFTHDPAYATAAIDAGVTALVVDWEQHAKERRQSGFNTEINEATPEDLAAMRAATTAHLICRINNHPDHIAEDLRTACALGADEILLPMVRTRPEIEACLDLLPPPVGLGIMVETREALALAGELSTLPLSRVYLGLHDLWIQRRTGTLFDPLIDGTVDQFRAAYSGSMSVAGVTLPDQGSPLPGWQLLAELARLDCDFGVARRSFRRDIPIQELPSGIAKIQSAWQTLRRRSPEEITADHAAFHSAVRTLGSSIP